MAPDQQESLGHKLNFTSSIQNLLAGSSGISSVSFSQFRLFFCVFQITSAITAQVWTTGGLSVWPNQGASASHGIPSTPIHTPLPPSVSQSWMEDIPTVATQGIRRKLPGASLWMKTLNLTCVTSQHVVNSKSLPLLYSFTFRRAPIPSPFPSEIDNVCLISNYVSRIDKPCYFSIKHLSGYQSTLTRRKTAFIPAAIVLVDITDTISPEAQVKETSYHNHSCKKKKDITHSGSCPRASL